MPSHILHAWKDPRCADRFRTGISLHSHTLHSQDSLAFLARHARHFPLLARLLPSPSKGFDYARAWWTPPLTPADAFQLESRQVAALGLAPIVSLTDHDSIDACRQLQLLGIDSPVSVEWTVPYGASFLHLGVHNLPVVDAPNWMRLFTFWTHRPNPEILKDILAGLHAMPGVLTVVNHPLWDEGGIGAPGQRAMALEFIHRYRPFLHALELNGLRSAKENRTVAQMAAECGLPAISGGDRHGCEPNANINLTNARTFQEFAAEIREDRHSHILFLPQYRESHVLRCLEAIADTLRDYPEYAGRERWSDRIFHRDTAGRVSNLTDLWHGAGPAIVRNAAASLRVFKNQSVRTALRLALATSQEEAAG